MNANEEDSRKAAELLKLAMVFMEPISPNWVKEAKQLIERIKINTRPPEIDPWTGVEKQ